MSHGDPIAAWLLGQGIEPMAVLFSLLCATVLTLGISLVLQFRSDQ